MRVKDSPVSSSDLRNIIKGYVDDDDGGGGG
jgi:hypothetical protein